MLCSSGAMCGSPGTSWENISGDRYRAQDHSRLLSPSANFPPDLDFGDEFQGMAYGHSLGYLRKQCCRMTFSTVQ